MKSRDSPSITRMFNQALHMINRLDRQDWMLVLIAGVILGFLCLRGFGSRSNY